MTINKDIIELVNKGLKPSVISKQLGIPVSKVYNVKSYYKQHRSDIQTSGNTKDLVKYDDTLIKNLKTINLEISNTLLSKSFKKESSTQLMKTLGISIDKLRLIEGKSTVNIAQHILHTLNPEQLNIIKESIKSLKESMLLSD